LKKKRLVDWRGKVGSPKKKKERGVTTHPPNKLKVVIPLGRKKGAPVKRKARRTSPVFKMAREKGGCARSEKKGEGGGTLFFFQLGRKKKKRHDRSLRERGPTFQERRGILEEEGGGGVFPKHVKKGKKREKSGTTKKIHKKREGGGWVQIKFSRGGKEKKEQ